MYSNCIKFNNTPESNPYRERASQQRRKFRKLYKDAVILLESRMSSSSKPKSATTKSIRKASNSTEAKHFLTPNRRIPTAASTTKRKRINSKLACEPAKKKHKDEPRCHQIEKFHRQVTITDRQVCSPYCLDSAGKIEGKRVLSIITGEEEKEVNELVLCKRNCRHNSYFTPTTFVCRIRCHILVISSRDAP
jgi:ribosomal protein S30